MTWAAARHPDAGQAYARAWHRWLDHQPNGGHYRDHDHSCVLAIPGAGPARARSPIGDAFLLTWTCVSGSARRCDGPAAFTTDAAGDQVLLDPWAISAAALLDAVMALGAPDLTSPQDAALLTTAWQAIATN